MGNYVAELTERMVELIRTVVPAQHLSQVTLPAIVCLAAGLLLLLWGARAMRVLIVVGCLCAGGYGGSLGAEHFGKPPAIGLLVGAAVLGALSLVMARIWIASLSGVLAGLVAFGVYAYQQDLPRRFEAFARSYQQPTPTAENEFPLGEPGASEAFASQAPLQVLQGFVEHLDKTHDTVLQNGLLYVGAAAVIGTVIALVALRWTMIFWTSLAGLVLLAGGSTVLLTSHWPRWHETVVENATTAGIVMLGVWLAGLVFQWRGTRGMSSTGTRPVVPVASVPGAA